MRAYHPTTTAHAARRHDLWGYLLFLSATVLPGGVLLMLLRWLWLRAHM
jgi:hypothetical protein